MTVTLVIAGDLCATGKIGTALSGPGAASPWEGISSVVRAADLAIVNVECPLADDPAPILKSGPGLWGPVKAAAGIRAGGFTAACLANNHILDAGPSGLLQTLQACHAAGLECVGAGENHASATVPLISLIGDLRLSVLAIAENEFSTTAGSRPGAWPFDLIDNAHQIARARQASDYVLVLLHGGAEHYPLPSPRLQKACRFFVDMGADAVICGHSHVAGGNEVYRECPIVYGMGNLLFDPGPEPPKGWLTGCLVRLAIGQHETREMELVPYRQNPATPSVDAMKGTERESFLAALSDLSAIILDQDLLRESWTTFCLERRSHLLGSILCLSRPESWLLDRKALPSTRLRLTPQRLARLRNLFSCESHAEACEQMLRDLLDERDRHR